MNIFFDLQLMNDFEDNPDGFMESCSEEENAALKTIWNYVYDRTYLLQDEIDLEESKDNLPKSIFIQLLKEPTGIHAKGYSDKLCKKIIESFNENDSMVIKELVNESLKRFRN